MARRDNGVPDCKIYVGGLPERVNRDELEEIFGRFGRLRSVWVARRPPGFAFIEFEDARDAEDAARALDGTRICGVRARVELSHGRRRGNSRGGGGGYGGGRRPYDDGHNGGPSRRSFDDRSARDGGDGRDGRARSRSPGGPKRYARSRSRSASRDAGRSVSRSRSRD